MRKNVTNKSKCGCSFGNRREERCTEQNRKEIFHLFHQLVLRYVSLYKCIPNVRSFISAFFPSFSSSASLLYDDNKNNPTVVVSSLLYMSAILLPIDHHYLNDNRLTF